MSGGGNIGNSSSSESGSLGISINLSNLTHPVPPPSTTTASAAIPLRGDPFVEPVGPTTPLPSTAQAVDFFGQNFDDDLFRHIVRETNLYASQKRSKWRWPLTVPELKAFLGVWIIMGIVKLPRVRDYWSQEPIFGEHPVITGAFARDRFFEILWNLHFNDNTTAFPRGHDNYDKLHKIRPVINFLSCKFLALYNPHRENSIDEAMVVYKGQSSLKQFMPKKPIKRGFKVWCRCDSKNGYTCSFQVYTGKVGQTTEKNLGARVVKDLSESLRGKNYHLYFDNFFSSPTLLAELLDFKIYCIGTVVANRKHFPKFGKARVNALERGEHIASQVIDNKVHCFIWRDRKPVAFNDTVCDHTDITSVSRKLADGSRADFSCPRSVTLYNQNMGGVDLADQLRRSYTCSRRSKSRWYMRMFWFFFDVSIINSYILESVSPNHRPGIARTGRQKKQYRSQLEFRKKLALELIGDFSSRGKKGRPRRSSEVARASHEASHVQHYPIVFPSEGQCFVCKNQGVGRKRTKYGCGLCGDKRMCPVPCFQIHHSQ